MDTDNSKSEKEGHRQGVSDLKRWLGTRTQKYRAWDKQDQRLIVHEQDFIPLKVTSAGVFRLDPHIKENRWMLVNSDRFILTESIGLNDRNDVEVFEGDIVRFDANYTTKEGGWQKGVVVKDDYRFVFDVNGVKYDMEEETDEGPWKWEVLGNIFENPALVGE